MHQLAERGERRLRECEMVCCTVEVLGEFFVVGQTSFPAERARNERKHRVRMDGMSLRSHRAPPERSWERKQWMDTVAHGEPPESINHTLTLSIKPGEVHRADFRASSASVAEEQQRVVSLSLWH